MDIDHYLLLMEFVVEEDNKNQCESKVQYVEDKCNESTITQWESERGQSCAIPTGFKKMGM